MNRDRPHRPHTPRSGSHIRRYRVPTEYYRSVSRTSIYHYWIQYSVSYSYNDGHHYIDDYPYYVYNGYGYRYSPVDLCNYELVDYYTDEAIEEYGEVSCKQAYDQCAVARDELNFAEGVERYFCAERVEDSLSNYDDDESIVLSAQRIEEIMNYIMTKSNLDAYDDAVYGNLKGCSVWKLRNNPLGCKYLMKVNGQDYPDKDGSICSSSQQAAKIGCDVGSHKENVGCIIKYAVSRGMCI